MVEDLAGADDGAGGPVQAGDARGGHARSGMALDRLLTELRGDLADGAYHPRERLVESDLVARYSTTRAAVRDALIQLASEGLVERIANRGARVRGMSIEEAIEIAEVRCLLETMCAGRAAERGTPAERLRLLTLARELRQAAAANQVSEYLTVNAQFHATIFDMAAHATARRILEQFQHRPIDRFFPQPFRSQPPTASVDEHERVAAAIAAGERAEAERAMREHLENLVVTLRQHQRA